MTGWTEGLDSKDITLLQIRISKELRRRLRVHCAELGISVSEFLRREIFKLVTEKTK